MGLGQISIRLGTKTCFIPKVSKFYVGKGYLYQQASKCHWQVNRYFRDQNIREMGDPWNEILKFLKWKDERNQSKELKE